MRWEYTEINVRVLDDLDDLGKRDWELVAVHVCVDKEDEPLRCFLKRPRTEQR